jgi:uncharacterized protein (TIGR00297 family)
MTLNDRTFFIIFAIAIGAILTISELIRRLLHWSPEATRKLVHIFVGILVATTPFVLDSMWPMVILGLLFAVVDFVAVRFGFFKGMHGTARHTYGTVFYPVSFVILTLSLWQHHKLILVTAMLIMAISDAFAAIVGEGARRPIVLKFGPEKKSLQGSIAMFVVTFLIVTAVLSTAAYLKVLALHPGVVLIIAGLVAVVAMTSEVISAQGSDNLTVPLSSAFTLFFMLNETPRHTSLFVVGMALALAVALISYRLRFLDAGGSVALFLLGTLVFGVGGWKFAAPILTFFILSSALSKMGKKRKIKLQNVFEKGSRRDVGQVLANGGIAGLMLIFWYFTKSNLFYVLYIAALAAVTADTWATEIGVMARGNPRSILNFKPVPMGTSGGISVLGTFGALLGSLVLVIVGWLCGPHASPRAFSITEAIVVLFAGLAASLVDSFLGATVQAQFQCPACGKTTEKRIHCSNHPTAFVRGFLWINNDVVNGFCALAGVLLVWLANVLGLF